MPAVMDFHFLPHKDVSMRKDTHYITSYATPKLKNTKPSAFHRGRLLKYEDFSKFANINV